MADSSYPGAADLVSFLISGGLLPVSPSALQQFIDTELVMERAIEEWERETRYTPFLADTADQTIYYSPTDIEFPPNDYPLLDLAKAGGPGGIVSVTSLKVAVTSTSTGTTLSLTQDYALRPRNAPLKEKPYTYIQFTRTPFAGVWPLGSVADSIVLTAKRGYWPTLNPIAKHSILARAAELIVPVVAAQKQDGAVQWREGDVQRQHGPGGPYSAQMAQWGAQFQSGVRKHKRLEIW